MKSGADERAASRGIQYVVGDQPQAEALFPL